MVGQKFNLQGEKSTDNMKFAFLNGERMSDAGVGTIPALTPEDITENLDRTKYNTLTYVSVTGSFDGSAISIEGQNCAVYPEDASSDLKLNKFAGHKIQMIGYYAGTAAPVVKVIPSEIVDLGVEGGDPDEEVYFFENFEWLSPWAIAGKDGNTPAGSTVETDDLEAAAPQIGQCMVDGVSALQAMLDKGYVFHRVTTKTEGECIYLQQNYLKMGKTAYQAGLTLPSISDVPANTPVVLEFKWCPMRQGANKNDKIDPVNLIVIISNGGNETTISVPTHGWENAHKLEWIKAEVDLSKLKVDASTKITIKHAESEWPDAAAHRWFIDDIKIKKAK